MNSIWNAKATTPKTGLSEVVLVVDDENDIRNSLTDFLKDEKVATLRARSGKEALTRLQTHTVAIIVMDIKMSDDGIETAAKVQELFPSISIIFLTAFDTDRNRNRASSIGVQAERWVDKDFGWHKRTVAVVLETLYWRRLLDNFNQTLDELQRNYPDIAQRHIIWKQIRTNIAEHLWQAFENQQNKYKRQLADQLSMAVAKIEPHQLLTQHVEIMRSSIKKLAFNQCGKSDVRELEKAWRSVAVSTLPSFNKILREWEELYSDDDTKD